MYGGKIQTPKRLDHPSFTAPEPVGSQDKPAEQIYDHLLQNVMIPILGNSTTFGRDIQKLGKRLFGVQWLGVFSVDMFDKFVKKKMNRSGSGSNKLPKKTVAVVNLDDIDEPGSHWCGIVHDNDTVYVYDSYGRDPKDILPKLTRNKKIKVRSTDIGQSDKDAEQGVLEKNCGARVMAALLLWKQFGLSAFLDL